MTKPDMSQSLFIYGATLFSLSLSCKTIFTANFKYAVQYFVCGMP